MSSYQRAILAMGCFWSPDALFGGNPGVIRTQVGYTGGQIKDPVYDDLKDHTEAVQIEFDPSIIRFRQLIDIFWLNHDSSQPKTTQYKSTIYYLNEQQKIEANQSLADFASKHKTAVLTTIQPATKFYFAENYHQKYSLRKHPWLIKDFNFSDEDLLNSPLAAKLNWFLSGKANVNLFEQLVPQLSLTKSQEDYVRQYICN